jgi:hypothetical protein
VTLLYWGDLFRNEGAGPGCECSARREGVRRAVRGCFNAKDKIRLEALYLPESRACITSANHNVYDAILRMEMPDRIPPDYQLTFAAVNENNRKAAATPATDAVKPESELHIDYHRRLHYNREAKYKTPKYASICSPTL